MKRVVLFSVLLVFLFSVSLQQVSAVSSAGKTTAKWGELKSKALEKGGKTDEPVLVMSEDDFAMAIRKYLSENQNGGVQLAPFNIPVGSYTFGIDFEYPGHALGACVYQKVPHLNIHISKNGKEVYNVHLGAYKDAKTGKFTLVFFGQDKVNTKKKDACKLLTSQDLKNGFNNAKNFIEDGLRNINANLGYVLPAVAITAAAYVIATTVFAVLIPVI